MAGSLGLINVKSAADLYQEEIETARKREAVQVEFTTNLYSHIKKAWTLAKEAKIPIENAMIRSLRAKSGIYESDKLAAIREMGGSELYVMLTHVKTRAFEAWVNDVLRPAGDKPWNLDPTPIPELNPEMQQEIQQEIMMELQSLQQEAQGLNIMQLPAVQKAFQEFTDNLQAYLLSETQEEAKEACEKMTQVIMDQQVQGNFISAFKQIITDIGTLKAGILKGPVVRMRKVNKWGKSNGAWVQVVQDELVPEFDRVSPFDFYPAPGATCIDDGDIIERHQMNRGDLVALIGVEGYSEEAIRKVLSQYDTGLLMETLSVDSERYFIEHGETGTMNRTGKIEALEFWGSVPGRYLTEWGIEGTVDPELEYETNAWVIGSEVIKAVINPDKLGRKPYSITAFEKIPGSIWGKGIPELMVDIQDVCNAVGRAIVNNSQLASGPMVEVNIDKCDANMAMHPWKIFQSTNQTMSEAPAVKFYQPDMYVSSLLQVYEFFSLAADEATGVPRWAYGNTNVGGAGQTSSGLSMLMTYAARGIKQVIQNIDDDITSPTLQRHYDYNMNYHPDQSVKGDVRVVARGSSALIAREQQTLRIKEVLQATANPVDLQLIGLEARLDMIKQMFKAMDISTDKLPNPESLPDVIEAIKQQIQQQQMAKTQGSGMQDNPANQEAAAQGKAPEATEPQQDNSGATAGGADTNLFKSSKQQ